MKIMRLTLQYALLMLMAASAVTFMSVWHAVAGSQYVILSAEPASDELPSGKLFVPRDIINVPAGMVVTLLGDDGSVNSISGPAAYRVTDDKMEFAGPTGETGSQSLSKLALIAGLLANERKRTDSIGGSRGAAKQSKQSGLDDPWAISIDESGPGCIRNHELVLVQKGASESVLFSVRVDDQDPLNGLVWSAAEATYSLPEPLPSEAKTLTVESDRTSARIEIKTPPANTDLANPVDILGWMVSSGCKRQALAFARKLASKVE